MTARVKKLSDCLKHVLPRMPADPGDMISFWDTCEKLTRCRCQPAEVQAKLLLPLLTFRAKFLVSRLSAADVIDITKLREFLTAEFELTLREYRARFKEIILMFYLHFVVKKSNEIVYLVM